MANKIISSIQFKRGAKVDLERIFVGEKRPSAGEPLWELDTNRFKIGDGLHDYAELPYLADGSDATNLFLTGYYDRELDVFWNEEGKVNPLTRSTSKIYIDIPTNLIYRLVDNKYVLLVKLANNLTAGITKLYMGTGQNTDGSMTQKAITDSLNSITSIDESNEYIEIKADF